MKKNIFALSFLILALMACSIFSGTPASAPELLSVSPTVEPATATLVVVMPTPTSTATVQSPAFTPLATSQSSQPNTIRFDAGGTWMDLPDSLNSGISKTYTLNAMQGQIMSVSILAGNDISAWGYFPIEVRGNDGTVLCPDGENTECSFWRGKLPSTQDYLITVSSGGDLANFTLRVAINPPGKAEQIFKYNKPASGLALAYPDQFAPARFPSSANNKTELELALQFIDTKFYENTNLGEVYFLLGSSSDPQTVATCTDPNPNGGAPEEAKGTEVINGYTFVHNQAVGAGAGNIYEQEIYRMAFKNVCYEAIYFIHYSNIGNYAPGAVKEFDSNALMQELDGVLSTFAIK